MEIIILLVVTACVIYSAFSYRYRYWKNRGIPFLKPSFPLGNIWESLTLRTSITEEHERLYRESEGHAACGYFMIQKPVLLIRDPDLVRSVLVKDFASFVDRGFHVGIDRDKMLANLFFLPGERWRNLRNKLTPAFSSGKMKLMFPIMAGCAKKLEQVLMEPGRNGEAVEIRDVIARYSTDIIASCAFGFEANSLENPKAEFRECGRRAVTPTIRTFITQGLIFFSPMLRNLFYMSMLPPDMEKYFTSVVRDTVNYREQNKIVRNDLMDLMIQLKNKGNIEDGVIQNSNGQKNVNLTMDELEAQVFLFFTAGFETSSTTATYCLFELAKCTEIQTKVREEVDAILSTTGGETTYDAVMGMKYLDMVVSETLRKYPPLAVLNREVVKEYYLKEYDCVLEKDTAIVISIKGLHYDPKYYPDPEKFDPERFSEENKRSRPQYTYLPFGEGPRNCIGNRFGLMQVKAALISLLHNYVFELNDEAQTKLTFDPRVIIATPKEQILLRLKRIR